MSNGIKEQRKKLQRSLEFLANHENKLAAFQQLQIVCKTAVEHLNRLNAGLYGCGYRFALIDSHTIAQELENAAITKTPTNCDCQKEDTTYGEQFRQPEFLKACCQAQPTEVRIETLDGLTSECREIAQAAVAQKFEESCVLSFEESRQAGF